MILSLVYSFVPAFHCSTRYHGKTDLILVISWSWEGNVCKSRKFVSCSRLRARPPLYYVNKEDMVEGRKVGGSGEAFLLPSSSTNLSCLRGEIKFGKVGASLPFPNLYFHVNKLCWVGKVSYCTHIHNGPDDNINITFTSRCCFGPKIHLVSYE